METHRVWSRGMVKELKTWLVVGLLVFLVGALTAQYNLYAIHKLSVAERSALVEVLPKGLDYRLGGEEYEQYNFTESDIEAIRGFIYDVEGNLSTVGSKSLYDRLQASGSRTHGNEFWFDIEKWEVIRKDFWMYLFRKDAYYRKHARLYAQTDADVINVPLPQNHKYRVLLDELSKHWTGAVSVHIYGKPEVNYIQKLDGWLREIKNKWSDVRVHELSGMDLKRYPNLKNSLQMRDMHDGIMYLLDKHNITEYYLFTLAYNQNMANWQNKPVYPRFFVGRDLVVIDELSNLSLFHISQGWVD